MTASQIGESPAIAHQISLGRLTRAAQTVAQRRRGDARRGGERERGEREKAFVEAEEATSIFQQHAYFGPCTACLLLPHIILQLRALALVGRASSEPEHRIASIATITSPNSPLHHPFRCLLHSWACRRQHIACCAVDVTRPPHQQCARRRRLPRAVWLFLGLRRKCFISPARDQGSTNNPAHLCLAGAAHSTCCCCGCRFHCTSETWASRPPPRPLPPLRGTHTSLIYHHDHRHPLSRPWPRYRSLPVESPPCL